jgi:hypothetical protein
MDFRGAVLPGMGKWSQGLSKFGAIASNQDKDFPIFANKKGAAKPRLSVWLDGGLATKASEKSQSEQS